ncbi:MAG: glycosyltransferase family 4 protein [Chloroflexi bacterium]|nr:glycosyltransferase family 4 protein [Chloroflexota bacterium]
MKICLLADTYPPDVGGLAVSVRRNARNLARAGHTVHVVSPHKGAAPGTWHTTTDGPVAVHRFGPRARQRETLAAWFDGIAALDTRYDFDLFHGHFIVYAGYVATMVARYAGKPSVVSVRGNDLDVMPFDNRRAPFVFKSLEWADAIVAVTRDLARKAQALSGRADVRVIHNGVDAQRFAPQAPPPALRATLQLDERPVIGFTGEARAKKGLGRMLRVFARLNETLATQMLLVGGVRQEDRAMVEFFRKQHPDLPLHIVPPQPNEALPPYYALCDVVILPSLRDGLPNTLLEAMACGRPVVASAVGGMLDVLTDGVDGIMLPPVDDAAWVDTLHRLLHDPPAREQLGTSARRTVVTRFTTAGERDATLALYREVVAGR